MSEAILRRAASADRQALAALWETAFGDPPGVILRFFRRFPPEDFGWVLSDGSALCAAAYLLTGNVLLGCGAPRPCGYVYAVASDPACRGRGCGTRLMRHFARLADADGSVLYTRPAEPGLFGWYRKVMGADAVGRCRLLRAEFSASAEVMPFRQLTPEAYGAQRELALTAVPHVRLSDAFLALEHAYARTDGGGFAAVGAGCAAFVCDGDTLRVRELLGPPEERDAAVQTLLRALRKRRALVSLTDADGGTPVCAYRRSALLPDAAVHWGLFLE